MPVKEREKSKPYSKEYGCLKMISKHRGTPRKKGSINNNVPKHRTPHDPSTAEQFFLQNTVRKIAVPRKTTEMKKITELNFGTAHAKA
jgi:hypothetical protein